MVLLSSVFTVCRQLCTNSSAGEGLGGIAGGQSTWDGVGSVV